MKLLLVSKMEPSAYSAATIERYMRVGREKGHELALFGEEPGSTTIPYSVDVKKFDFAVFLVHQLADFPDLPYLARILDGIPRDRRVVIDPAGRFNETIRVEHDFNHLERMEGHQGWEWIETLDSVASRVLQPTLHPRRADVRSFFFFGFDPTQTARRGSFADKPYGLGYIGNNWQRWSQLGPLFKALTPIKDRIGKMRICGHDWDGRPEWAAYLSIAGVDVDPQVLYDAGVETWGPLPNYSLIDYHNEHRISPIVVRPLYRELGLVSQRMFETFSSDTVPMIALPEELAEPIYGKAAKPLLMGDDPRAKVEEILAQPERALEAVAMVRSHLAEHHSIAKRFEELERILSQ